MNTGFRFCITVLFQIVNYALHRVRTDSPACRTESSYVSISSFVFVVCPFCLKSCVSFSGEHFTSLLIEDKQIDRIRFTSGCYGHALNYSCTDTYYSKYQYKNN